MSGVDRGEGSVAPAAGQAPAAGRAASDAPSVAPAGSERADAAQATAAVLTALRDAERQQARRCGALALASVALFLVIGAGAQWLRGDLDWQAAPLSFYLLGDYGLVLKAAYFALAVGLLMLGLGARLAFGPRLRVAPLLFLFAGLALVLTALFDTDFAGTRSMTGRVHGLAAQASFLCVSLAMLLQSWSLREFPEWRGRFAPALALALLATAALWLHAIWREAPRGLMQKGVILLILCWLGLFAYWLRGGDVRGARAARSSP